MMIMSRKIRYRDIILNSFLLLSVSFLLLSVSFLLLSASFLLSLRSRAWVMINKCLLDYVVVLLPFIHFYNIKHGVQYIWEMLCTPSYIGSVELYDYKNIALRKKWICDVLCNGLNILLLLFRMLLLCIQLIRLTIVYFKVERSTSWSKNMFTMFSPQ